MSTENSTFQALVKETKATTKEELIERIWYRTVQKVADFEDDAEDTKRFVTKIEEHVNKIFPYSKATPVETENELTFMDKQELLELWILYVVESDTLGFGKLETGRVLKAQRFFQILAEYFQSELVFTWNKLVKTYKFLQNQTDPRDTAVLRAYSNVWAKMPYGYKFVFLDVQNAIFPKPAEVKLKFATKKRKIGPNNDGYGGGGSRTQSRARYGGDDDGYGGGEGRTQTRARYDMNEGSDEGGKGGSDRGKTKTKKKLKY